MSGVRMCQMLTHITRPLSKPLTSVALAEGLTHVTHMHYVAGGFPHGWEHCHICNTVADHSHFDSVARKDELWLSATIYLIAVGAPWCFRVPQCRAPEYGPITQECCKAWWGPTLNP